MKNERMRYSKRTLLGVGLVAMFVISFTSATVFNLMVTEDLTLQEAIEYHTESWVLCATGLDPGNGVNGITNISIYPHSASSVYNSAISEATAYENTSSGWSTGDELGGETPHSTAVDICVTYQFSDDAYNYTSLDWDITLVKAYYNESQLSVSSQLAEKSTDFFDQDGTTDAKINFYLLDADGGAGTGFIIGQTEQIDDTQIKIYVWK